MRKNNDIKKFNDVMLGNNDVLIIVFLISFFIRLNTITFSIKLSAYIIVPDLLQLPGKFSGREREMGWKVRKIKQGKHLSFAHTKTYPHCVQ